MNISKSSWHYRLNDHVQAHFSDRVETEIFTTCTYIRTTIRSAIEGVWKASAIIAVIGLLVTMLVSSIYLPIAAIFGLMIPNIVNPLAALTYLIVGTVGAALLYEKFLKPRLEARKVKKISLLKQAMMDKKEGVCTIVRFE